MKKFKLWLWRWIKGPKSKQEKLLDKKIADAVKRGETSMTVEIAQDTILAVFNEMGIWLDYYIKNHPEAKNFVIIPCHVDNEDPSQNFNIILHKWGKKLPNKQQMIRFGGLEEDK